jgi:2'-5' RNA ligase
MRLFFAFDLSPDSKAAIADWRDRYTVAEGRSVPPGNFHITLVFLGDLEERLVERLCDRVDERLPAFGSQPARLTLDRVGYWPSPGIYWLGTGADITALAAIVRKLGSIAEAFGARRERQSFVPHVTLYRRCASPPPAPVSEPRINLELQEITLFESIRGRSAVSYRPLASWPLPA